jgi:HSP20 family protein
LDWRFCGGRDLITKRAGWTPRADIRETDENFDVKVEVPGIKREDVKNN